MATRGDVLELKREIGFGAKRRPERFVVLQADALSVGLESVIVAPLDESFDFYRTFPGAVPVSGPEAGRPADQVLLLTQLASVAARRFQPAAVGRLHRATLDAVDGFLRIIFDLR